MSGVAEHLVPMCDPVWEATRPDRGPVTYWVEYDPKRSSWEAGQTTAVPCYSEIEAAGVRSYAKREQATNIRTFSAEEYELLKAQRAKR